VTFRKAGLCGAVLLLVVAGCTAREPRSSSADAIRRGDELVGQKRYAEAADAYRIAVSSEVTNGQLRKKLANALLLAGRWTDASGEAVRAADLLPGDIDAQLLGASFMLGQERFVDVVARTSALLEKAPDNFNALILWGNATARLPNTTFALSKLADVVNDKAAFDAARGALRQPVDPLDDKAAEASFRKALTLVPDTTEAQLALVNFLWATDRLDDAEALLHGLADHHPQFPLVNYALGQFYVLRHRDAEPYLRNAAAAGVEGRGARFALVDYYLAANREAEARSVLSSMNADDDVSGDVSVRLATDDFRSGHPGDAVRRLDALLMRAPNHAPALRLKARVLFAMGNPDLRFIRAALSADPTSVDARVMLSASLRAAGDSEGALAELTEALQFHPDSDDLPLRLAEISLDLGRDQDALQFGRDAERRHPDDPQAALVLVRALMRTHNYSEAGIKLKELLAHGSPSPDVWVQLGALQSAQGDTEAARAAYAQALTANHESLDALAGLVSLDLKAGNVAAARQRVDQAVASHANNVGYLILVARVYEAQNDLPHTERTLRQVLAIDPGNVGAALSLVEVLRPERRSADARDVLDRLLEHRPQSLEAQTELASLLDEMGDVAQAQIRYERIVGQYPHAAVPALKLATLYADQGDHLDKAFDLAVMAVQQLPDDPAAADALGWVYTAKNMATLALPYLQRANRAVPNSAVYRSHLGSAYLRTGDRGRAQEEFTRALQIDRNFRYAEQMLAALRPEGK
jgi:tetratricopeptide (TPR) repeat protein